MHSLSRKPELSVQSDVVIDGLSGSTGVCQNKAERLLIL